MGGVSTWAWSIDRRLLKVVLVLLLAALATELSQLILTPVYGSIPAGTDKYHQLSVWTAILLAFRTKHERISSTLAASYLPTYAFLVPCLQHHLCQLSSVLGPQYGPLLTESVTTLPLVYFSFCIVARSLKPLRWISESGVPSKLQTFPTQFSGGLGDLKDGISVNHGRRIHVTKSDFTDLKHLRFTAACTLFLAFKHLWSGALIGAAIKHSLYSRVGLQICVAVLYMLLFPSRLVLMIALGYLALFNPHLPLQKNTLELNNTLQQHGFSLLERIESVTGYISVLENINSFRALRCDHSLLGGQWLPTKDNGVGPNEPIYSVFTMLEAVRLMQSSGFIDDPSKDASRSALVIGLGIGTCPKALASHKVNTTVVEVDPAVTYLARKYFELPSDLAVVHEDAVAFVGNSRNSRAYDYVVHDVFTGGAEPVQLFTLEFLTGLRRLLKKRGYIVINYAGDVNHSSTAIVLNTIRSVFRNCKAYRDQPKTTNEPIDFVNVVVFCSKSSEAWHFREPVEADYLKSQLRRQYLVPEYELAWYPQHGNSNILTEATTAKLTVNQKQSALRHWSIMRTVLPDIVWEQW